MQISQTGIFDLSGKKILQQASNSNSINIERLASGIYFVQVDTNNGIFTQKFIKK
jgi:predicted nucleotidyltransferase